MALNRYETWVLDPNDYYYRRDRSEFPKIPDTFVLGTTDPTATNSGAGVIRPFPTTVINGNVTVATGTVVKDVIINGFVSLQGTGAIENCYVRGPSNGSVGDQREIIRCALATGNFTGAVEARDVNYTGAVGTADTSVGGHSAHPPVANVRFCTIEPQTPTAWMSGIGVRNYYAYRNKIINTVDGFAAFSDQSDHLSNTRGEGNYMASVAQFRPDPANGNRASSHNDIVQWQGNRGGPLDSVWIGNHFDARLSTVVGTQPPETVRNQINAMTISVVPAVGAGEVNAYVYKNWLLGGVQTFNGGSVDNALGEITVIDNLFERPGTAADGLGPDRALVINSNMGSGRITTPANHYIDNGAVVPVGNS